MILSYNSWSLFIKRLHLSSFVHLFTHSFHFAHLQGPKERFVSIHKIITTQSTGFNRVPTVSLFLRDDPKVLFCWYLFGLVVICVFWETPRQSLPRFCCLFFTKQTSFKELYDAQQKFKLSRRDNKAGIFNPCRKGFFLNYYFRLIQTPS